MTFFSNFDGFSKFVPFWGNLSAKTQHFHFRKIKSDFMTPLGPLGARPYRFEQKYCPNRLCVNVGAYEKGELLHWCQGAAIALEGRH